MAVPTWATQMKAVAPGVYAYIQGGGPGVDNNGVANAGLIVGDSDALVIDTLQAPIPTKAFQAAIAKVTRKPVRRVINTHFHGDHTNGNQFFPDAEIIGSPETRNLVIENGAGAAPVWAAAPGRAVGNEPRVTTPPDVTFVGRVQLYYGAQRIELHRFEPAHSPGDVLVYLPQHKVLFAGDTCFFYVAPHFWTGSAGGSLHVFDWIETLDVEWIVPGHGPLGTKADMRINRGYVERLRREARARFDAGMSAVDAAASIDMGEYKDWPDARDRIVGNTLRLYREFMGGPYEKITEDERHAAIAAYLKKLN